jgi:hypothetical protein
VVGEPGDGSSEEPGAGIALLVVEGFDVDDPGVIINRDMQEVIAELAQRAAG